MRGALGEAYRHSKQGGKPHLQSVIRADALLQARQSRPPTPGNDNSKRGRSRPAYLWVTWPLAISAGWEQASLLRPATRYGGERSISSFADRRFGEPNGVPFVGACDVRRQGLNTGTGNSLGSGPTEGSLHRQSIPGRQPGYNCTIRARRRYYPDLVQSWSFPDAVSPVPAWRAGLHLRGFCERPRNVRTPRICPPP